MNELKPNRAELRLTMLGSNLAQLTSKPPQARLELQFDSRAMIRRFGEPARFRYNPNYNNSNSSSQYRFYCYEIKYDEIYTQIVLFELTPLPVIKGIDFKRIQKKIEHLSCLLYVRACSSIKANCISY